MMNDQYRTWLLACPVLLRFCETLSANGIVPHRVQPEIIATHLRSFMETSHPFNMREANAMIQILGLDKVVFFLPRLKLLTGKNRARGAWFIKEEQLVIYIEPVKKRPNGVLTRPKSSMIFTLLHEIAEIILDIGYMFHGRAYEMPVRQRERWANRFAGMCMMPRKRFERDVAALGLDLRELSEEYEVSLAAASRQIRDVALKNTFYYFCRCEYISDPELEFDDFPESEIDSMSNLLDSTNGCLVRIRDVVRKQQGHARTRSGALPMYNLPGSRVYRVMHPVLKECVESGQPLLIDRIPGGAGYEHSYSDLFDLQDMSLLIIPYGRNNTTGFFLQAVEANAAHYLHTQADELKIVAKKDIPWLFSTTEFQAPFRKKRPSAQKALGLDMPSSINDVAYRWLKFEGVNWKTGRNPVPQDSVGNESLYPEEIEGVRSLEE